MGRTGSFPRSTTTNPNAPDLVSRAAAFAAACAEEANTTASDSSATPARATSGGKKVLSLLVTQTAGSPRRCASLTSETAAVKEHRAPSPEISVNLPATSDNTHPGSASVDLAGARNRVSSIETATWIYTKHMFSTINP
jgi:hypothetical protein